jgi:hypothetical protein
MAYASDYAGGTPQNDQRDAITMALMKIANPGPRSPMQQQPQGLPMNVRGGLSSIGNAIGDMRQPAPPAAPGPPMSLAPPAPPPAPLAAPQAAQQPPPVAPPPQVPLPQGTPVGAGNPMPQPQVPPQGPQGLY